MGVWRKEGKATIAAHEAPLFRDTDDYGRAAWQEPIRVSSKWYVWRMNQEVQRVAGLDREWQRADIGLIMPPSDIVHKMRTGEYDMPFYPSIA